MSAFQKLLEDSINDWTKEHERRHVRRLAFPLMSANFEKFEAGGEDVALEHILEYCNLSVWIYREISTGYDRARAKRLYEMWTRVRSREELFDNRFFAARMCTWGKLPSTEYIIATHSRICDIIETRLQTARAGQCDASSIEAWQLHSRVQATCRAVLLIADRNYDVEMDNFTLLHPRTSEPVKRAAELETLSTILVVLTGDGPLGELSFEGWRGRIIDQIDTNVARMPLQVAFDFVREAQNQEEDFIKEFREANDRRRKAHFDAMAYSVERELTRREEAEQAESVAAELSS